MKKGVDKAYTKNFVADICEDFDLLFDERHDLIAASIAKIRPRIPFHYICYERGMPIFIIIIGLPTQTKGGTETRRTRSS